jgi:hypothetical protein
LTVRLPSAQQEDPSGGLLGWLWNRRRLFAWFACFSDVYINVFLPLMELFFLLIRPSLPLFLWHPTKKKLSAFCFSAVETTAFLVLRRNLVSQQRHDEPTLPTRRRLTGLKPVRGSLLEYILSNAARP